MVEWAWGHKSAARVQREAAKVINDIKVALVFLMFRDLRSAELQRISTCAPTQALQISMHFLEHWFYGMFH